MPPPVMPTADPDQLEAQARRLRTEADALEHGLDQYERASSGATWQGRAGTQFKNDTTSQQRDARGLANDLRNAAAALDAGARDIREYRASLKKQQQPPVTAGH